MLVNLTDLRSSCARGVLRTATTLSILVVAVCFGLGGVSSASAATPAPAWTITSVAAPTNFTTEVGEHCGEAIGVQCDSYIIVATNVGDAATNGPITVNDTLPSGIVTAFEGSFAREDSIERHGVTCPEEAGLTSFTCSDDNAIPPGGYIAFGMEVKVTAGTVGPLTNVAEVRSPEAPPAVTSAPGTVATPVNSGGEAGFGAQDFNVGVFGAEGGLDAQAGGHPSLVSTKINYTTLLNPYDLRGSSTFLDVEEPKTQIVDLPAGFVGDPQAAPACPQADLYIVNEYPGKCPAGSIVGQVVLEETAYKRVVEPIFNVVPEGDEPALFAFEFDNVPVYLRSRVLPTSDGYVVSVAVPDIQRSVNVLFNGVTVTFYGDPTEHDGAGNGQAFLTNPAACGSASVNASAELDSWVDPEHWTAPLETPFYPAGVSGCGALRFEPTLEAKPAEEQTTTDTPTGYEVNLKLPQSRNVPGMLANPDLKDAVVTLPEGVSVDPSAANGLVACAATGAEGIDLGNEDKLSDENRAQEGEELGEDGLVHPAAGHCPGASQIGEVEAITPLLASPLKGHVYVATPGCGGAGQSQCTPQSAEDGELFGIYLEVAGSGVIVKLKGDVSVNPQTGRLTTRFQNIPEQPLSEVRLKLDGGSRAPLANPQSCGSVTATSDLTPSSAPATPDATPFSSSSVTGCGGGFSPGFSAGMTTTLRAGAYSPFTLSFSRHDGEQDLAGLTVNLPEGLIGKLAGIAECGNGEVAAAEANTGACPSLSRVGTATAAAGAGSTPFYQSGPVYLTGPYNGAPFGLAVVVPANAGPFHLGNIVVRAAIHINPSTAQVTVVSNPLPQMIDGVPLRVQSVNVTVGEGGNFTFNPTNCSAASIGATISSAQGAAVPVSVPFAATGCKNLPFKPLLSATTAGKASKAGGASLDVKVVPAAGQANIAKLALELPKQLPARLTTLQKACLASVFEANPAACPSASDIGSAIVHTPVLNGPLAGPVYLVSHGGEAFPDVEIVLQGEGVQLVVDGHTQIKNGVTYNHFETIPDAPFTSFETKLPTGKYSIFGTNLPETDRYNLCGHALSMPVTITGQNGAVLKQTTKIAVTSCPKAKVKKKAAKKQQKQVKGKK
jgi:hypothetical protein